MGHNTGVESFHQGGCSARRTQPDTIFFIVSTLQIVFNVYCIRIMTYEPGVLVRRQQREYPPELRKEIALAALEVGNNR